MNASGDRLDTFSSDTVSLGQKKMTAEEDLLDKEIRGVPLVGLKVSLHGRQDLLATVVVLFHHCGVNQCQESGQPELRLRGEELDERHRVAAATGFDDDQFRGPAGQDRVQSLLEFPDSPPAAQYT
ncbi:MAG: hypothetical protein MK082_13175 [Phycisphaerales bacterium]|nr:hypothetical protein [Phycisphaerales bacterium]